MTAPSKSFTVHHPPVLPSCHSREAAEEFQGHSSARVPRPKVEQLECTLSIVNWRVCVD
jgi:hypothetical protein